MNICEKRIQREGHDLIVDPLPCVTIKQINNLSTSKTWHVNIHCPLGAENCEIKIKQIHCIVNFPDKYPISPPEIYVSTPYCHVNVNQTVNVNNNMYKVCLDMLEIAETTVSFFLS
jgi:ubiquitin-protein ligase